MFLAFSVVVCALFLEVDREEFSFIGGKVLYILI
jgi:hypothetical protein